MLAKFLRVGQRFSVTADALRHPSDDEDALTLVGRDGSNLDDEGVLPATLTGVVRSAWVYDEGDIYVVFASPVPLTAPEAVRETWGEDADDDLFAGGEISYTVTATSFGAFGGTVEVTPL